MCDSLLTDTFVHARAARKSSNPKLRSGGKVGNGILSLKKISEEGLRCDGFWGEGLNRDEGMRDGLGRDIEAL